jgi:hypothetical protein
MARLRFLQSIAAENWSYDPQQVAEVDGDQAIWFVRNGIAEPVDPDEPVTAGASLCALGHSESEWQDYCPYCRHVR